MIDKNIWDEEYYDILHERIEEYMAEGYTYHEAAELAEEDASEYINNNLEFIEENFFSEEE